MTSFVDVVYSTYFLNILLLQHGDIETNPGHQKEKIKNSPIIGMLTVL